MQYVSVDHASRLVAVCGRGTLIAKTDRTAAYRDVPVHANDQHLIDLEWNGTTYMYI